MKKYLFFYFLISLFKIHFVPDTVLGTWNKLVNKIKFLALAKLTF